MREFAKQIVFLNTRIAASTIMLRATIVEIAASPALAPPPQSREFLPRLRRRYRAGFRLHRRCGSGHQTQNRYMPNRRN